MLFQENMPCFVVVQAQVNTLELEKDCLGQQIDSLMLDRQHLLQVKMSLGLEVATYRYLSMSFTSPSPTKYNLALSQKVQYACGH